MPRTLQEIRRDFDQWLTTYTAKHCPGVPLDTLHDAVVDHAGLLRATIILDRMIDTGHPDLPAVETAARTLCLGWIAALKTLQVARSPQPVPETHPKENTSPAARESTFGTYQSSILGDAFTFAQTLPTDGDTTVTYLPTELSVLRSLQAQAPETFPDRLRTIHQLKRLFGGDIHALPPEKLAKTS